MRRERCPVSAMTGEVSQFCLLVVVLCQSPIKRCACILLSHDLTRLAGRLLADRLQALHSPAAAVLIAPDSPSPFAASIATGNRRHEPKVSSVGLTSAPVTAFLRAFAPVADLLSETLRFLCPRTYEELEPIAACIPRDRRLLIEQSNFTLYRQVGDVWLELGVQYATRGQGRCRP